ncbi:Putative ankyrin repeat domain-containing protein 31, partial [Acanthisitta chloris]
REAFNRSFVNLSQPLSRSQVCRRNEYGETILHRAVMHQDLKLLNQIIKAGGNVNTQDYTGCTALHMASMKGFYRIVNELLKAGADVNATQNQRITPLQYAAREGHIEVHSKLNTSYRLGM